MIQDTTDLNSRGLGFTFLFARWAELVSVMESIHFSEPADEGLCVRIFFVDFYTQLSRSIYEDTSVVHDRPRISYRRNVAEGCVDEDVSEAC